MEESFQNINENHIISILALSIQIASFCVFLFSYKPHWNQWTYDSLKVSQLPMKLL